MSDENLNTCNKCGSIQNWATEMYWKGEECIETNEILGDYIAVCDDCFYELKEKKQCQNLKNVVSVKVI